MISSMKLDHIGIACTDVEVDAKWYQDVLGFSAKGVFSGDGGHNVYFLQNGNLVYEMYQIDDMDAKVKGKVDHIAYHSDNLEEDYEYYKKNGYKITTNGIECCPTFWEHGCFYFKIESPCGEQIEFCKNK